MKRLREYLVESTKKMNEAKMNKLDMDNIYRLIEYPRNYQFQLTSVDRMFTEAERTVISQRRAPHIVVFEYNLDFYDLTTELVTICDNLGYRFRTQTQKNENLMIFEIFTA